MNAAIETPIGGYLDNLRILIYSNAIAISEVIHG